MSLKRSRSTDIDEVRKLQHGSTHSHGISDLFPYQEIFLRVLSFLSPTELVAVQGVNRHWAKMSLDQQLWKRLYLARYPHPHHSRLIYKSHSTPDSRSLRPIARLPSRAFPPPSPTRTPSRSSTPERRDTPKGIATPLISRQLQTPESEDEVGWGVRNDGVDWKMMLRLGTNWSNGNASSETTINLPPSPSPSISSLNEASTRTSPHNSHHSEQHIALFPSFIVTSNPTSPLVHVHRSSSSNSISAPLGIIPPPPGWSSPSRPDNVTAICADHSVSFAEEDVSLIPARLAIFYQSGGFVILRIRMADSRLLWTRESIHPPQSRPRRRTAYAPADGDRVVLAAFNHPVLLTCTHGFHLSVYTIPFISGDSASQPHHIQTMHSDVSFHPATLSLFPLERNDEKGMKALDLPTVYQFRAALTYCTPLYPSSWTVAVQEFSVDLKRGTTPLTGEMIRGDCWHVGRGDDDALPLVWPRKVTPTVGIKGQAVGVGTDGRWAVLAGVDNQIQVYSLPTPPPSPSSLPIGEREKLAPIKHSQTLLAHSAAVTSISLSAGRCVSGGRDGRILVWELDDGDDGDDFITASQFAGNGPSGNNLDGRLGRTVGFVEVRPGGRRQWRGAAGPLLNDEEGDEISQKEKFEAMGLPHPASISSAARSLFLPRPPELESSRLNIHRKIIDDREVIRHLAFDEEKIVGLIKGEKGEVMRVWGFNG